MKSGTVRKECENINFNTDVNVVNIRTMTVFAIFLFDNIVFYSTIFNNIINQIII